MQPEQLFREAEQRALQLEPVRDPDLAVERLRAECVAFFDLVPEPPVYRRANDPVRKTAADLLPKAQELLTRCLAVGRAADASLAGPLADALKAQAETLCRIAEGRVGPAEEAWRRSAELERKVLSGRRLWARSDEALAPVFDRKAGASRFDPRPEPMLRAKLVCPGACRSIEEFSFSPRRSNHAFACSHCGAPFLAYIAEARGMKVAARRGGAKRYTFKVEELGGGLSRIEFEDASGEEFNVARRDLLAFLYSGKRELRGVLNLSTSRILQIQRGGPCFVASVAFGADAPELAAFRAFRDRVLMQSLLGSHLVRVYSTAGPRLAGQLARAPLARRVVKAALARVHRVLLENGFDD